MIYYNLDALKCELNKIKYGLVGVSVLQDILERVKYKGKEVKDKVDK